MRRVLSWLIVSIALAACRDIPQAPKSRSAADLSLSADSANAAAGDSARLTAAKAKASKSAGANNTPAVISNIQFPATAQVGQSVTMQFNFTDDVEDSPWFVSIDWSPDDGGGREVSSFADPVSFSFAYLTAGHYTVVVHVYDNFGADAFFTRDIDVTDGTTAFNTPAGSNVKVTPTATPNGTPATLTFPSVTTAGNTTVGVSSFQPPRLPNLRSGSSASLYAIATTAVFTGTVQVCITYDPAQFSRSGNAHLMHEGRSGWEDITTSADAATHSVCGGTTSFSNFFVALANEAPTAALVLPQNVNEATTPQLTVNGHDVDGDALTYVWSFGDGSAGVTTTQPSASHFYGDNGTFNVSVVARDPDGLESAPSTMPLTVANVAPSATLNAPASVNEGSSITVSLSNPSDPSSVDQAAGFSYAFDCGNGFGVASSSPSGTCPAADNGIRVVKAKIRDKDLGERVYQASVNVVNVAPTIGTLTGPFRKLHRGDEATVSASYSDPGSNDTFVATVDWGDGVKENVAVQGGGLSLSHVYNAGGDYTVCVFVTDKDGGRSATAQVVISVVGGGHTKPADVSVLGVGAFDDPRTPDKARGKDRDKMKVKFNVFAHSHDGSVGRDAKLDVRTSKLTFHARTFDVLDVNDPQVLVRGEGRIDGDSRRYGYLVSAIDGDRRRERQRDFVRIRMWNMATGQVVFDSEPGARDNTPPSTRVMDGGIEIR